MELQDLPFPTRVFFMTVAKAAITCHSLEKDKEFFVSFCRETWNSMVEMGPERFEEAIMSAMASDIVAMSPIIAQELVNRQSELSSFIKASKHSCEPKNEM